MTQEPFRIAFVLLPKFSSLTLSSLVEPLRIANYCDGSQLYQWSYLSVQGGAVPGCSGYNVATEAITEDSAQSFDAAIVCGGWNAERYEEPELERWLRLVARRNAILGAAEMGAYVLARAGLLSGYAVTIHWHCRNAFKERYTDADLRDQVFVIDRNRMTCAGGVACLDMMLADISTRFGRALSDEVAEQVVYLAPRDAMEPQRNPHERGQSAVMVLLKQAVEIMEANIERTIRIPEIAHSLGLSQRKLERLFNRHFGCSAVAFYRRVRLQRARVLLTHTDMSVLDISIACGFASSSYFSKSYAEEFGMRPRDHRLAWPDTDKNPYWPGLHSISDAR
jgi:AraC family carnitine catabolism transcriptional activator